MLKIKYFDCTGALLDVRSFDTIPFPGLTATVGHWMSADCRPTGTVRVVVDYAC